MLKNFLIGTFAVLMISTATSINSIAGEIDNTTDEVINVTEETLTYDVTVDVTSGNVILISEDAERYGINTVKLNLEVNAEDVYCEFEPENSVKITASRYDNESHMLNIYMSGTDPLFDSDSHRVTSLMQADRILVLDGGRVADVGTHAELITRPGIYKDIYDIQMSSDDRALIAEGGEA